MKKNIIFQIEISTVTKRKLKIFPKLRSMYLIFKNNREKIKEKSLPTSEEPPQECAQVQYFVNDSRQGYVTLVAVTLERVEDDPRDWKFHRNREAIKSPEKFSKRRRDLANEKRRKNRNPAQIQFAASYRGSDKGDEERALYYGNYMINTTRLRALSSPLSISGRNFPPESISIVISSRFKPFHFESVCFKTRALGGGMQLILVGPS